MNKLLFIFSLGLLISGCSKSSTVKPIVIVLTGSYVSYKEIDTAYNAFNVADGIEYISIYTASGDTLYNYPGTIITVHTIQILVMLRPKQKKV